MAEHNGKRVFMRMLLTLGDGMADEVDMRKPDEPPKIASMNEAIYAMETIHHAMSYKREGKEHGRDAKAEHQHRQARLVEIRAELAKLVDVHHDS